MISWKDLENKYSDRNIVMFGVGRLSYDFFAYTDLSLFAVIDNDRRKQGMLLEEFIGDFEIHRSSTGKPLTIQSPEHLAPEQIETNVYIIASYHVDEIRNQLREMGAVDIFSVVELVQDFAEKSDAINSGDVICDKKIVVDMGYYGDHGYAITKALLKTEKDLDIVWIIRYPRRNVLQGVRMVYESNRSQYLFEMQTARIWIFDKLVPNYVKKKEGQIYIQVKHWSSITLKKFYMDVVSYTNKELNVLNSKYNAQIMDYIISGSAFDEESCRSGFLFQGEFLRMGSPRSDILFDIKERHRIKKKLGIEDRIVMYAPTYRDSDWMPDLDFKLITETMQVRFGGEWSFILKLHPSVIIQGENKDGIIDLSSYENIQELLAVSDVVITDYSSLMFEPAYVGKPVFLYASDINEYINRERELLMDYKSLPFPFAETSEKLRDKIMSFNEKKYRDDVSLFMNQYGVSEDGHASERVAEWIIKKIL